MLRILQSAPFASYRLLKSTFAVLPSFVPSVACFAGHRCFASERGSARSVGAVALNTLSPAFGSRRVPKRLGRGVGSGTESQHSMPKLHASLRLGAPCCCCVAGSDCHQVRARLREKVTKVKPPVMVLPDQVLREDRPRCIVAFRNVGSPIPMPYF